MARRVAYSAAELAWIEAHKDMPRRQLHVEFIARFGRDDVSPDHIKALCKRRGWLTGRTGHFSKGIVPANKGKKMPYNPNSAATRFKKGNRPHNAGQVGHERLTADGYVEISVAERNPYTGADHRYVHKHRWLWEQVNGPVPEGMRLKCLDGDRKNSDPSNWEALPYAMAPRLNGRFGRGYDDAPDELKPTILATAKLEHLARTRKKEAR